MYINPHVNTTAAPARVELSSRNRDEVIQSACGPMTRGDVEMLREATGINFNWPPGEMEGFPMCLPAVQQARERLGGSATAGAVLHMAIQVDLEQQRYQGTTPKLTDDIIARAQKYCERHGGYPGPTVSEPKRYA